MAEQRTPQPEQAALASELNDLMAGRLAGTKVLTPEGMGHIGPEGEHTQGMRIAYIPEGEKKYQTIHIQKRWFDPGDEPTTYSIHDGYQDRAYHQDSSWEVGKVPQRKVAPAFPEDAEYEDVPAADLRRYIAALRDGVELKSVGEDANMIVGDKRIVKVESVRGIAYSLLERVGLAHTRTL